MIESSLRVRDDLVADSASYNMLLTTMLRSELGRPVWGNWTLDPVVEPGMVGAVDPLSGIFDVLPPVAHPVQHWRRGQGAVDIQGFWPADYDVAWAA
jgi:hypothetical protein